MFISTSALAPTAAQRRNTQGVRRTLEMLRDNRPLFRLIATSLIVNFSGMAVVLLPIFVVGRLGGSSVDLGLVTSCYAGGREYAMIDPRRKFARQLYQRVPAYRSFLDGQGVAPDSSWREPPLTDKKGCLLKQRLEDLCQHG